MIRLILAASILLLSGSPPTAVPVTKSDNFNRANSGNLGANWSQVGTGSIQIISNTASSSLDSQFQVALWAADTFTANQFSRLVVPAWQSDFISVIVRSTSASTGYGLECDTTTWRLFRMDTDANLASGSSTFSNGDAIEIRASGTTITALKNSTTLTTQTSALFSSGQPGFAIFHSTGGSTPQMDDWSGGDL